MTLDGPAPRLVHATPFRLRLRWPALRHPALDPCYLEAWLEQIPGVLRARVNPAAASLILKHDGRPGLRDRVLEDLPQAPREAFSRAAPAPPRRRLPDALVHLAAALGLRLLPPGARLFGAALLAAPPLLRGLETLLTRGVKAPVLDMATIGFSLARGDAATAAGISAMVVIGDYLRQATEDRSNGLLKNLLAPPVKSVRMEDASGRETSVAYGEVRQGHLVLCGPGETLAVDGVVERGRALLNTSSSTGESCPVEVMEGQAVRSGSLVTEGRLAVRAASSANESTMARMALVMKNALADKSPAERLSDRLADRLALLTLGLGAGLYAATGDARRALSVLTVDYACAVKLPAPVVVKATMYAAAKQGVLVKSGSALDALSRARTVVFDKTGTLTRGQLALPDLLPLPGVEQERLLLLAASAEERWGHPAGRALIHEARERGLKLLPARNTDCAAAHGVSALVDGIAVQAGSRRFLESVCGIPCGDMDRVSRSLRSQGKSLVYVALDGRAAGVLALRDSLRPEAAGVLAGLRKRGVERIVVLTGDHAEAARTQLRGLDGVDEVRAGLDPGDKARIVEELRAEGRGVAVVGEGLNDAPALLAGDVGICLPGPSGLTRESAGIALLRQDLGGLLVARDLGARADSALRGCFAAGVTVNTGLLLAAGAGLLSPVTAAALHNGNTFALLSLAAWACGRANAGVSPAPGCAGILPQQSG